MNRSGDNQKHTDEAGHSGDPSEIKTDAESSVNRRGHARLPFGVRVTLHELDETGTPTEGAPCEGHDISRSGMGVRSRRMYYAGRKVIVAVAVPGMQPRYMCGEVKYSRYTYRGLYHVGIELCAMPQTEAVRSWVQVHQHRAA